MWKYRLIIHGLAGWQPGALEGAAIVLGGTAGNMMRVSTLGALGGWGGGRGSGQWVQQALFQAFGVGGGAVDGPPFRAGGGVVTLALGRGSRPVEDVAGLCVRLVYTRTERL